MAAPRSEDCATVAFYGVEPSPNLMETVYRDALLWFTEYGRSPDVGGITRVGQDITKAKMEPFSRVEAMLKKRSFSDVVDLSVLSLLPGAELPLDDYALSVEYSMEYRHILLSARTSIAPLTKDGLLPFAARIAGVACPEYGIGYVRPSKLGPIMYAIGIVQGLGYAGADDVEAQNISFWGNAERAALWTKGILRDVYPWNFLTASQLKRSVDGTPLETWIRESPKRGVLSPVSGGLMLWEVEEANLLAVRRALWKADVLYNWPRHIEGASEHPNAHRVTGP